MTLPIRTLALICVALTITTIAQAQKPDNLPDIDVLYIERTPRYPGYRLDYDRPGQQGVPVLVDNMTHKPLTPAQAASVKRWPGEGEVVVFTAHVQNRGNATAPPYQYTWSIDGKTFAQGTTAGPQSVGKEVVLSCRWNWKSGRHTVKFTADPLFKVRDLSLNNNSREDATDAWSLIWAVDRQTYTSFNSLRNFLGTKSFEDWAQWHIDRMNHLFDISPTPGKGARGKARGASNGNFDQRGVPKFRTFSPNAQRLPPRIRCDKVVVVDDVEGAWDKVLGPGVQPLDAGYDGAWPFGRREDCTEWAANADWGLIHEWGHQLGLTDEYALDRAGFLNLIPDANGDPLLIGHLSSQSGYMMHGHGPTTFSPVSMGALITQPGRRRGYYGDYYYNIPAQNFLQVLDSKGAPVPGAKVTFWQDTETEYNRPPVFSGKTDQKGLFALPNRPAPHIKTDRGYVQHDNPFGKINIVGPGDVFFVRIEARGHTEYAWMDIAEFNLAYWQTGTDRAVFTRKTHIPPVGALPAPVSLKAEVNQDDVTLTWQPVPGARGYRLYHGGPDLYQFESEGGVISGTNFKTRLGNGALHRYAVTAIGANERESGFSNTAGAMHLIRPWGLVVTKDGKRLIRDAAYGQAVLQKADGNSVGLVGSVHYHFEGSYDIALDSKGRLLSAKWGDGYNPKVGFKVQNPDLKEAFVYLETEGSEPGHFNKPMGIGANSKDHIFVADTSNNRIQEFSPDGKFIQVIGQEEVRLPMKVAFDKQDRLYVADSGNNRIAVYTQDAEGHYKLTKSLRGVIREPCYVALDSHDRVFVSTNRVAGLYMFGADDKITWSYLGTPDQPLSGPRGLAFDGKGNILIVDDATRRVLTVKMPPVSP